MIHVDALTKIFTVHEKEPGLKGSLKALFVRKWIHKTALRSVSLDVTGGEIVGLVGANGAGKTTLVKILSGIIHPTSGEASVLGFVPWERTNEFRSQIALIMGQKAQLWWDLPAGDCFLLLKDIYRIPHAQYKRNLSFLTDMLGVQEQLKIQVRRLSLGERMKMELIAALLHNPKIIFLDEPTIGLDISAQRSIRRFLRNYSEEFKPAIILTSHYMDDIEELCKRIVIIRTGEIVYDGELSKILETVASKKQVSVVLSKPINDGLLRSTLAAHKAEIKTQSDDLVSLSVERAEIPQVLSKILEHLPVTDLSIQEEDISNVIEALIRKR